MLKSNKVLVLSGVNAATFTDAVNDGHVYYTNASQSTNLNDEQLAICKRAKKLIMEYNENQNACDSTTSEVLMEEGWQKIDVAQESLLKVTSTGIEYPKFINAWGRIYAVVEAQTSESCRPVRRTIVKGRIGTRYPGFEFPNLVEGDVVKIFNVNGKKIAEVSGDNSGKIVWNGRKDSGDWAKSGIYVYQIKVKETGKLISGTIVFVY